MLECATRLKNEVGCLSGDELQSVYAKLNSSLKEIEELKLKNRKLTNKAVMFDALETAGVYNWEGIDIAIEIFNEKMGAK